MTKEMPEVKMYSGLEGRKLTVCCNPREVQALKSYAEKVTKERDWAVKKLKEGAEIIDRFYDSVSGLEAARFYRKRVDVLQSLKKIFVR